MYLKEISTYKIEIMKTLCLSKNIISFIKPHSHNNTDYKKMMYKYIFPYIFIDETITDMSTFICFDLDILRVQGRTFKDITLNFWVFTHHKLMRTKDGLRTDLLAYEIDKLFNGNKNFGLGEMELKSVKKCYPIKDYYGSVLNYKTVEFNRKI